MEDPMRIQRGPPPFRRQRRTVETLTLRYSATSVSVNSCFPAAPGAYDGYCAGGATPLDGSCELGSTAWFSFKMKLLRKSPTLVNVGTTFLEIRKFSPMTRSFGLLLRERLAPTFGQALQCRFPALFWGCGSEAFSRILP